MTVPEILDVSSYAKKYGLKSSILGLTRIASPELDLNEPGLIMHGSEADPYTILKYGLATQRTKQNELESEWQVCLGLNSKDINLTLDKGLSRKNSAVKYAGYFSDQGIVYILSDEVKSLQGYREFWKSEEEGGYAWVSHAIVADIIKALITINLPLAAAAMAAAKEDKPIYQPDGICYHISEL